MAARFRTKDRVLETSITTGAGTYTLAGAPTGFQAFLGGGVASGDLVPYWVEDGTNWEAGIGTVLSAPARLERTHVLKSSNANAAVDWGDGTRNLRCAWPAELDSPRIKSVDIAGGAGDQALSQDEQRCDILILTGALTGNRNVIVDTAPWVWGAVINDTTGSFSVTLKVTGETGVAVAQGKSKSLHCNGTDVADSATDFTVPTIIVGVSGRLTLASGDAVPSADQTGKTTVYFTPYNGDRIPIYDGSGWVATQFAELSQTTADNTKSPAAVVAEAGYDKFVWNDAGTVRCTRGPAWSRAAAVTMTIAAPCVVTWAAHGLRHGAPIVFTTTGALPTGVVAGTVYYINRIDANSFNISSSLANVLAGTFITSSGSQSGVHTGTNRDTERGTGAGTTELELFEGRLVNKYDITNGPAARRGLFVGSIKADASAQINDAGATGATACLRKVSNFYNRRPRPMRSALETADSWTYTTAAYRLANANVANRLSLFNCAADIPASAQAIATAENSSGGPNFQIAIGLDRTTETAAGFINTRGESSGANDNMALIADWEGLPGIGSHDLWWIEHSEATGTTTWFGDAGTPTLTQSGMRGTIWA